MMLFMPSAWLDRNKKELMSNSIYRAVDRRVSIIFKYRCLSRSKYVSSGHYFVRAYMKVKADLLVVRGTVLITKTVAYFGRLVL